MNDSKIYLFGCKELLEASKKYGIARCGLIDDISNVALDGSQVVVVDYGDSAKEQALTLAKRGVDQSILNYVSVSLSDGMQPEILSPKHLRWDDVIPLSELGAAGDDFPVYKSGIGFLDKDLSWGWRLPELVILAGPYGCGKSTLGQILAANFVNQNGAELGSGALLCSWEDLASEVHSNFKNFDAANGNKGITKNVHFVRREPSLDRNIPWLLDLISYHRRRYGTRIVLADPWNEFDHIKDPKKAETEYVMDVMKDMRRFVDEEKIILIITTHVSGRFIRGNGEIEPFKIGHAFGSSQYANKADRGICLVRTKNFDSVNGHSIIRLDKSKVERKMGRKGTIGARFDAMRFSLEKDGFVTQEVKDVWKD